MPHSVPEHSSIWVVKVEKGKCMLKDKKILILGATGGIGSTLTKLLVQSGAQVFLAARDSVKLSKLASDQAVLPQRTKSADLMDLAQILELRAAYFSEFDSIDIFINASGIGIIKPTEQLTSEEFIHSLQINLIAPFQLMQAFLPAMKEAKKGLIIHIPGVLGKVPMAGAAAYSASKYGLVGMLQSIREEVKRTDIRITNLFLGGTNSPFWDTIALRVQKEKMVTSEEAAKAIWFLCQQPVSGVVSEMVLQPFNHQAI